MTLEEARLYVTNFPAYEKEFSEEVLNRVLPEFDVSLFQETRTVREGHDEYLKAHGYPETGRGKRCFRDAMIFRQRMWFSDIYEDGVDYLVPAAHQLKEELLLRKCLLEAYPYLEGYDMQVYHLDGAEEIYITCAEDTNKTEIKRILYVPLQALRENNAQLIRDRMTSYFNSYYVGEHRKKYRALSALESKEAERLFGILDEKRQTAHRT